MDEAEFRAIAKAGRDIGAESWDEARHFVEHTFIGACYLLHERAVDVGHAIRNALPTWLRRRFS
jgi:hypothetical protein